MENLPCMYLYRAGFGVYLKVKGEYIMIFMNNNSFDLTSENAVDYLRVSTKEQKKGTSLEDQKQRCREVCKQAGMNLIEEFVESASAMKGGQRPEFNKMVQMLKEGKAKVLICAYTDRLTRNGTDGDTIKELIEDYGITVVIADSNRIIQAPIDPTDYLLFAIEVIFSNLRVLIDRQRCKAGIVAKHVSGTRTTKPPYAYLYDSDAGVTVVIGNRADFVRKAFELYATGNYSISEVANELFEQGFRYELQPSGIIPKQSLVSMLKNTFYMGEYHVKQTDEYVTGTHEPIVSKEIFEKVQKLLELAPKAPRKNDLLYSKLLSCPTCGHCLTGDVKIKPNGKQYVYYRCTNPKCLEKTSINETTLDNDLCAYLKEIRLGFIPNEIVTEVLKNELCGLTQELSNLKRDVSRKYHREQHLQQKIDKKGISDEKYIQGEFAKIQDEYGNLEAKIYHTEKTIEIIKSEVAQMCEKRLYDVFTGFDTPTKRKVLELVANIFKCNENGLKITFKSAFRKIRHR